MTSPANLVNRRMDTFTLLHEGVRQVLAHRLGWEELRPVQDEAYREVVAGKDVLIIAPTAGGKTEAALIPVVDRILKEGIPGVAAVYIAPLKALINDQEERFSLFSLSNGLDLLKWHGDVPRGDRAWKEGEPPHILMITPESLEVLLMERELSSALHQVHYIIIDELHAFVESERGVHMRVLLDRIDRLAGRKIQRIGLSATVGNPEEILSWLSGGRHGSSLVQVPAVPAEKRFSFVIEEKDARRMRALAAAISGKKALVFVNSRGDAEEVTRALSGQVDQLLVHHSSLSISMRKETEEAFSRAGSACIICTSTLELGIDIGDLDVVVQVGPPASVSSFLQRMGRTGRRGKPPYVACVLKNSLELLCMVAVIESAMQKDVEPLLPPQKPYDVLVQQILLELLRSRRSSRTRIRKFVRGLSPFFHIRGRDLETLLSSMTETGFLDQDGDLLFLGYESERLFGRSNWKDLFSVISGGGEFRAVTPEGELIGKLDSRFVAGRSGKSFSLGGKSWTFIKSDQAHELAVVVPGEGERSDIFWTGGQSGLSSVVCRGVEQVIARGGSVLPLPAGEGKLLSNVIDQFPALKPGALNIIEEPGKKGPEVTIFTFRGRKWNSILAALLKAESERKLSVSYHDFSLAIKNASKKDAAGAVYTLLENLRLKSSRQLGAALAVPPPGTWKFVAAIPEPLIRDMSLTDYYQFPIFWTELRDMELVMIPSPSM
jgi:ATP-dependent Lhr-like helicase